MGLIRDSLLIVGVTVLILVLGNFLLGLPGYLGVTDVQVYSGGDAPVYDVFADKSVFWAEHDSSTSIVFEPHVHWRTQPFTGQNTNIGTDGARVTVKPKILPGAKKVFFFGGSVAWGYGAPDADTIPSRLQTHLGSDWDVYNFGQFAYVSTQELNYLMFLLSINRIPDVVFFYDGANDGYAGVYSPAIPRDLMKIGSETLREKDARARIRREVVAIVRIAVDLYEASNYKNLFDLLWQKYFAAESPRQGWDRLVEDRIADNSRTVIDQYESHMRQARALGAEYGFKVYFVWQPNLFSLTRSTNAYEQAIINSSSSVLVESQNAVYKLAKERFSDRDDEGIFFFGNIFDDTNAPIYHDWVHIGPNGNEIVARELAARLSGRY